MTRAAFFIFVAGVLLAFLSTFELLESPPTWFDEGHIVQVAINVATHGPHAELKVAPNEYESGAYSETTGFPVTYPVALSFKLFGINLLSARIVMVAFIFLFVFFAWRLAKSEMPLLLSTSALWLLVTFAPLYGNGKNVLGEVPGLFYLTVFLVLTLYIEHKKSSWIHFFIAGLFLALAITSKPIFLLVLLPTAVMLLLSSKFLSVKKVAAASVAFLSVLLTWMWIQFKGQSVTEMILFYFNPFGIDVGNTVFENALLFVRSPELMFALLLLLIWGASVILRFFKKQAISRAELVAISFTILVYVSFLKIEPFYRYLFVGEMLALIYFPQALATLWPKKLPNLLLYGALVSLVLFQLYMCFFDSWVADHYNSRRTAELTEVLGGLDISQSIFVYNVPEAVLFLPQGMPFYQYFHSTSIVKIGESKLQVLESGTPDLVLTASESIFNPDLRSYEKLLEFNRYILWQKI